MCRRSALYPFKETSSPSTFCKSSISSLSILGPTSPHAYFTTIFSKQPQNLNTNDVIEAISSYIIGGDNADLMLGSGQYEEVS